MKVIKMKKTLFALLFVTVALQAQAQYWVIKGTVVDPDEKKGLRAATVVLLNQSDSSRRAFSTDESGAFRITGVLNNNYTLSISFVGFKTFSKNLTVKDKSQNLGQIVMEVDPKLVDGVIVDGVVQRVTQKGDTVEMNADAYKVNPDANAEELIEKMPGVVVQNGKVQAQGEDVKRVLVDGREFFGDEPMRP